MLVVEVVVHNSKMRMQTALIGLSNDISYTDYQIGFE